MKAGFASVDITPPLGTCLCGHFNRRPADGLHDPLLAQVMVLDDGESRVALIGTDLVAVQAEMTAAVRESVHRATGIAPECTMLWATHTHAGPYTRMGGGDERDDEYIEVLEKTLAGAVQAAAGDLRDVELKVAWGHEERIAFNRRYRMKDNTVATNPGVGNPNILRVDGPMDPTVGCLYVTDATGLVGCLMNYACHCDVLGNGNFKFAADYPYYMREMISAAAGQPVTTLFANGACGNINHINVFGHTRQGGFDHARMMGMLLAGEALKVFREAEPLSGVPLAGRNRVLEIERRMYSDAEIAEFQRIAADESLSELQYHRVRARQALAQHAAGRATQQVEVQAVRIGDLALLAIPAEYFVEYGLLLRERSSAPHTFVVELANDCIGYVPTPEALVEGGYEGASARYGPDTGQIIAENVLELV